MNKTELINAMAEKAGITKTDARKAYDGFVEAITDAMKKDDKISLIGFGTFSVVKREARTGLNPLTKKKMKIAAKKVMKFKPSKSIQL